MSYDYLIVGAGFAGSVCARQLADAGKRVLIIDKRDHIGGNAYDYTDEHGVRIHKYGPHLFHTNSDAVLAWLSRFTEWTPYEHRVRARVGGKDVPFPINLDTLEALGLEIKPDWPEGKPIVTAEDQCLATVGRELYELFFKGYTEKMWGVPASELDRSVTARIPIRSDRDDRYFTDKHQALPRDGYTAMFERMLDHPGIEIQTATELPMETVTFPNKEGYPNQFRGERFDRMIWTGPVDQFFAYRFDRLPYRSLKFHHSIWKKHPPHYELPAATVNLPGADMKQTRVTEWARLQGAPVFASTLTFETPCSEGEPFYPMPTPAARALYKQYEALADKEPNVTFLGRLGTYQYLNMDQVVGQALAVSARLLGANPAR